MRERATTLPIAIIIRALTIEREVIARSKESLKINKAKKIRAITLQREIEKGLILR